MTVFTSVRLAYLAYCPSNRVSLAVLSVLSSLLLRFLYIYFKARSQFPGPPVKNFWVGNLDQTVADNVNEKVAFPLILYG